MLSTDRKRRGPKQIEKRGRGALARFRGCRPRKLSGRCPHPRVTAVAKKAQPPRRLPSPWTEAVDFLDLGARASKKVEHWRARLCGKQRKSTASGQGEGSGTARDDTHAKKSQTRRTSRKKIRRGQNG